MIIRTRVFELASGRFRNLTDLAMAMDISVSQIYRVRDGKRGINEKFIIGAKKAFPGYRLDELFYFSDGQPSGGEADTVENTRYSYIVQRFTSADF